MACQRFRCDRGNRHRGAVNVCDRSGRSPVGRAGFAGWKRRVRTAGRMLERPSGGGTAGVVRWLARTRQAVHPFTRWPPPVPLATGCPPRQLAHVCTGIHIYNNTHTNITNLFSSPLNCRLSSILSLSLSFSCFFCLGVPPFSPSSDVSALDPYASARLN